MLLNGAVTLACYACERCQKQFESQRPARYCSPACKQAAYRDRHRPPEPSPNQEDAMLEQLVGDTLARCQEEGVDPKDLLMYLKLEDLKQFLSKCDRHRRGAFVARLLDWYMGLEDDRPQ